MQRVSEVQLREWRGMAAEAAITRLCEHAKIDVSFKPMKDPSTSRWHVSAKGSDFELLLNGPKFFDTQLKRGGGGAIDLAMHLYAVDFKGAVELLRTLL